MMSEPTATIPYSSAEVIDPEVHAALARWSSPLSGPSAFLAVADWAMHMAISPGKRADLARLAWEQYVQLARYALDKARTRAGLGRGAVAPLPADRRFAGEEWQHWPFDLLSQSFLLTEQWWRAATRSERGVGKHHADVVAFAARQLLDMLSPGNYLATNPVALQRTLDEGGANLVRGAANLFEDLVSLAADTPPAGAQNFVVGRDLAVTPGKVVLRNRLIELIQYSPATATVHPEPVLIVPAWIMKYYILDLSPGNSMIRYLVGQGHTVFCVSWRNPDADDLDLGMDDYLDLGFRAALAAVEAIVPRRKVHAVGYCLGGTLLAIAAAAMARDGDARLQSMTLLAAQTDFTEPGELGLFIDEGQVSLLEAQMAHRGYLTAAQMAGAFSMLRSYDLLWSRLVNHYLLGRRTPMNDLMAWNADATRLPAKMHSQYLRRLFLNDDLSEGRYPVDGRPVALSDITLPTFAVGTVTDHVSPWRSVYKLHHQLASAITFVLTSGGHNAGIVSEPGHPGRSYRVQERSATAPYVSPDDWLAGSATHEGSWWPAWSTWLKARSSAPARPPRMGAPGRGHAVLGDAPGEYVLHK